MDILKCEGINDKGYGTIAKSVMTDTRLSATAKAIYAYFCSYAGAGKQCFPSRDKICYDLNITTNTYTKHLRALIEYGYITVCQERVNGRWARNIYTLNSVVPCTKKPCTKISDTEKTVYQNLNTNNNNIKNKIIIKSSSCIKGDGNDIFDNLNDYDEFGELDEDREEKKLEAFGIHHKVMLNGWQVEALLKILSVDEFDYYIEKLDAFIAEKNAKVKNHYVTIKRWVNEDRGA